MTTCMQDTGVKSPATTRRTREVALPGSLNSVGAVREFAGRLRSGIVYSAGFAISRQASRSDGICRVVEDRRPFPGDASEHGLSKSVFPPCRPR